MLKDVLIISSSIFITSLFIVVFMQLRAVSDLYLKYQSLKSEVEACSEH